MGSSDIHRTLGAPAFGDAAGVDAAAATNVFMKIAATSISGTSSKSVVVTLTKQGTKAVKPPTKAITNFSGKGSIACPAAKGCTVPGPAATAGSDTFTVVIFSSLNGKGTQLATLTVTAKIKAAKTTVSVAVPKIVKSASVAAGAGTAGTAKNNSTLALTFKDPNGLAITTGTFSNAVTVTDSDATGATKLSGGTGAGGTTAKQIFVKPGSLSVSYTGAAILSPKFTPSGSAVTGTAGTFTITQGAVVAAILPKPSTTNQIDLYALSGTGSSASFTVTQPGWKSSGFPNGKFTTAMAFGTGNCGTSSASSFKITGSGASFGVGVNATVNSGAGPNAGKCTLTVTGGAGQKLALVLTFTTTGIGINGRHH
jgi:hypothetical protein